MVEHMVWREQNRFIQMKILSLYNAYHAPEVEDQVFAWETGCCGHQVVPYQPTPIVQTLPLGAKG